MKRLLFILALLLPLHGVSAQSRTAVDTSTDIFMFLPGAVGAGVSLVKGDYKGLLQLTETGATAVAINLVLKNTIHKRRPDGSGDDSFPSNHAMVAFGGAAYLQRRYGWDWGIPAYLAAGYVAWGRVYAKKHDFWDVLAGAAIGTGCAYVFTTPFATKHNVTIAPATTPCGRPAIYFSMAL